jgi:hypothetical protein
MSKKQSAKSPRSQTVGDSVVVRANINRQMVEASEFVSLYANDTQIQLTPWDVRLIFGVISDGPRTDPPEIVVKTIGEVRMSPQHAKRVAMILIQQLENYEENVGPIPQPKP